MPADILDRLQITDFSERHRQLELMEAVLMVLAMKRAGVTESLTALRIVAEMLEAALGTSAHPPTRTIM